MVTDVAGLADEYTDRSPPVIHYGPVWFEHGLAQRFSFAACEATPPNAMSTHRPWVNCEACRQSKDFGREG